MFDLFRGAGYLGRGLRVLRRPGVRRYAITPIGISIGLFSGLIVAAYFGFEWLMEQLLPQGYEWLQWLLWPLFALSVFLILVYGFTLMANLAGAPFNGALSAAVERSCARRSPSASRNGLLRETVVAFGTELRRIGYYLIRAVPLLLLFVIPGVNVVAPLLWLIFSAWMLGLEYASYPMDNHGVSFRDQRREMSQRPMLTLGFGGAVLFATMIPVINFFVMPAAVAGATLLYLERIQS
ncbi:MAG: sulfate transporter CysZ [Gammaproteobacteria bacterium]